MMRYILLAIACLAAGFVGGYWQGCDHMAGELMQARGERDLLEKKLGHQMTLHGRLMQNYNAELERANNLHVLAEERGDYWLKWVHALDKLQAAERRVEDMKILASQIERMHGDEMAKAAARIAELESLKPKCPCPCCKKSP